MHALKLDELPAYDAGGAVPVRRGRLRGLRSLQAASTRHLRLDLKRRKSETERRREGGREIGKERERERERESALRIAKPPGHPSRPTRRGACEGKGGVCQLRALVSLPTPPAATAGGRSNIGTSTYPPTAPQPTSLRLHASRRSPV